MAELGVVGDYIRIFHYREALEHAESALQLAESANAETAEGAAAGDIATIYKAVGDGESALAASAKSVALLEHSSRRDFYAQALVNTADIQAALGRTQDALVSFHKGIAVAHLAEKREIEAFGQEHLAAALLSVSDLKGAQDALEQARALELQLNSPDLAINEWRFAELDFQKRDLKGALAKIDSVSEARSPRYASIIRSDLPSLKGKVLLAMGKPRAALASFQAAVSSENERRQDLLPADISSVKAVVSSADVYRNYIQLAASLASETHDRQLARKALEVLVANRAWSLHTEMLGELGRQWKLPPAYYAQLNELQDLQAQVTLGTDPKNLRKNKAKLQQLRLSLTDLENKSLLADKKISITAEKDSHKTSLSDIQSRLGRDELLCSFFLGPEKSFLWTVTKDRMDLSELPAERTIEADSRAFVREVRGAAPSRQYASKLSADLFESFPSYALRKHNWLLALDGALLDGVPLSALPAPGKSGEVLVVSHTLRLLAAEALLASPQAEGTGTLFVGIADPVYNQADSRQAQHLTTVALQQRSSELSLARLVGTDREVRKSAVSAGLPKAIILTGTQASASGIRDALTARPEIVHFAVHVVSPEDHGIASSDEAALALSLSAFGRPELLTKENIATLRVPGSLVVLSGCASQQGEVLPAAGIVGLSRAWLLAGASAVLVTAWPTPDDSGQFFQSFYTHFHNATGNMGQRASAALQAAQAEMETSSGYRSRPSFWSAYSLISKE